MADPRVDFDIDAAFKQDPLSFVKLKGVPLMLETVDVSSLEDLLARDAEGDDAAWAELETSRAQDLLVYYTATYNPRTEPFLGLYTQLLAGIPMHTNAGGTTEKFLVNLAYSCAYARRPVLYGLVVAELFKRTLLVRGKKTSFTRTNAIQAVLEGIRDDITPFGAAQPANFLRYAPTEGEVKYYIQGDEGVLFDTPPDIADPKRTGDARKRFGQYFYPLPVDANAAAIITHDYGIAASNAPRRAALQVTPREATRFVNTATEYLSLPYSMNRLPEGTDTTVLYPYLTVAALRGLETNDFGVIQKPAVSAKNLKARVAEAKTTAPLDRSLSQPGGSQPAWVGLKFDELDSDESDEGTSLMAQFRNEVARREMGGSSLDKESMEDLEEALAAAAEAVIEEESESQAPVETFSLPSDAVPAVLEAVNVYNTTARLPEDNNLLASILIYAVARGTRDFDDIVTACLGELESTPAVQDFVARLAYSAAYARRGPLFQIFLRYIFDTTEFDGDSVFVRQVAFDHMAAGIADLTKATQGTAGSTPYTPDPGEFPYSVNDGEVTTMDDGSPRLEVDNVDGYATQIVRASYYITYDANFVQEAQLKVSAPRMRELADGISNAFSRVAGGSGTRPAVSGNLMRLAAIADEGQLGLVIDLPTGTSPQELPITGGLEPDDVPQADSPIGSRVRHVSPPERVPAPSVSEGVAMVRAAEENIDSVDPIPTLAHLITTGFEGPVAELIFALVSVEDKATREVNMTALVELAVLAAYYRRSEIYGLIIGQIELNSASTASTFYLYRVLIAGADGVVDLAQSGAYDGEATPNPGEIVEGRLSGGAIDSHLAGILTRNIDLSNFTVEEQRRMLSVPYLALDARIRRLHDVFVDLDGTSEVPSASVAVLRRFRDEAVDLQIKTLRPVDNPVLGVLLEGTPARINYTVPLTLDAKRTEIADTLLATGVLRTAGTPYGRTGGEERAKIELDAAIRILQRGGVALSNDVANNSKLDTFRDFVSRCAASDLPGVAYSAACARRASFFWVVLGEMSRRNVSFSVENAIDFAINGFVDAVGAPEAPGTKALRDYQANPGELNVAATGATTFDIGVVDMYIAATLSPLETLTTYDPRASRSPTFVSENALASLIARYSTLYGAFTGSQPSVSLVVRVLEKMYTKAKTAQGTVFAEPQLLPPPPSIFDVVPSEVQIGSPAPPTLESQVEDDTESVTTSLRSMSLSSNNSSRVSNSMPSDDSGVTVGILDESAAEQMQETSDVVLTRGVVAGGLEELAASVIGQAANSTQASRTAPSSSTLPIQDANPNESADLVSSVVSSALDDSGGVLSYEPGQREDSVNTVLRRLGLGSESPDVVLPPPTLSPIRGSPPRRGSFQSPVFVSPWHPVEGFRTPGSASGPARPRPLASPVLVGRFTDAVPAPVRAPVLVSVASSSNAVTLSPAPAPPGTAAAMAVGSIEKMISQRARSANVTRTTYVDIDGLSISSTDSSGSTTLSFRASGSGGEGSYRENSAYTVWQEPVSPVSGTESPLPDAQPPEWMDSPLTISSLSLGSASPVPRLNLAALNSNPAVRLDSDGVLTQIDGSDDDSSSDTDFSASASARNTTFRKPLPVRGLRPGDVDDVLYQIDVDSYDSESLLHVLESIASNKYSVAEVTRGALFNDEATFRLVLDRYVMTIAGSDQTYDLFSVKRACALHVRPRLLAVLVDCKIRFDNDEGVSRANGGDLGQLCDDVVDGAMDVALSASLDVSPVGRAAVHSRIYSVDTRAAMCMRMLFHDVGRHSTQFSGVTPDLLDKIAGKIEDSPLVFTYAYLSFVSHLQFDAGISLLPRPTTDRLALNQHSLRLRGHATAFIEAVGNGDIAALQSHWDNHLLSPDNPLFGSCSSSIHGFYLANSPRLIVTLLELQDLDLSASVAAIAAESMTSATRATLLVDRDAGPSSASPSSSYVQPAEGETREESEASYRAYLKLLKALYRINTGQLNLGVFLSSASATEIKYVLTSFHAGRFNMAIEDVVENFIITTQLDDGTVVYSNAVDYVEIDVYASAVAALLVASVPGLDNYEALLSPWLEGVWSFASTEAGDYLAEVVRAIETTSSMAVKLEWLSYLATTDLLLLYGGKPLREYTRIVARLLKSKKVVNNARTLLLPWTRRYVFPEDKAFVMWEDLSTIVKAATLTPNMTTFVLWYAHFEDAAVLSQFGTGNIEPNEALVEELASESGTRSVRLDVAFMLRQRLLDRLCKSKSFGDKEIAQRISTLSTSFPLPDPSYVFDARFDVSRRVQTNLDTCIRLNRGNTLIILLRDVKYSISPTRTPYTMDSAWIDDAVARAAASGSFRVVRALLASFGDRLAGIPYKSAAAIGAIDPRGKYIGRPTGLLALPTSEGFMPTPRTQEAIVKLVMKHICPPALAAAIRARDYDSIIMYGFIVKWFDMHDERVYAAFVAVQRATFTYRVESRERGSPQKALLQEGDERIVKVVLLLQAAQEQAYSKDASGAGPST